MSARTDSALTLVLMARQRLNGERAEIEPLDNPERYGAVQSALNHLADVRELLEDLS